MADYAAVAAAEYTFARHEHSEIRAGLDAMHAAADALGRLPATDAAEVTQRVRSWISGVLVPHAAWEDAVVYAEIDDITGTKWATKLMRFEHFQIERAAGELDIDIAVLRAGVVTHDELCAMRGHLLGLEAVLRAHLEREEVLLLPIVDQS